jgi:hypothetical protein
MEIGVTEAAAVDAQADLPGSRCGSRYVFEAQRALLGGQWTVKEHRAHRMILSEGSAG